MYQNFIEVACIAWFFYLPYQKSYIPLPYYHWFYQVWLKYQPLTIWSFIYPTKIPIVPHHLHWFPLHHKLYLLCLLWPFFIRTLLSPWHMCLKNTFPQVFITNLCKCYNKTTMNEVGGWVGNLLNNYYEWPRVTPRKFILKVCMDISCGNPSNSNFNWPNTQGNDTLYYQVK